MDNCIEEASVSQVFHARWTMQRKLWRRNFRWIFLFNFFNRIQRFLLSYRSFIFCCRYFGLCFGGGGGFPDAIWSRWCGILKVIWFYGNDVERLFLRINGCLIVWDWRLSNNSPIRCSFWINLPLNNNLVVL